MSMLRKLSEKSLSFHLVVCLAFLLLGVFYASLHIKYKAYPVSLSSPKFIARTFLRMLVDTLEEEFVGNELFLPVGRNTMAKTKKRTTYDTQVIRKFWDRSVSGSSPLLFQNKKKASSARDGNHPKQSLPCTATPKQLANGATWSTISDAKTVKDLQHERSFLDTILIPSNDDPKQQLEYLKLCSLGELNEEGAPLFNLHQLQTEQYICFEGAPDSSRMRIHIMALDPLRSDVLLPLEGKNVHTSEDLMSLHKAGHGDVDHSNHDPSLRVPEVKYGELKRGDCVFLPSFWWIYMHVSSGNSPADSLVLTKTSYKPHSSIMEVFSHTMREALQHEK